MIVPKKPEADVVREALEGFANGRFGTQADVRQFLRERDFKPRGYGKGVYHEQVRRLLTQELYAGFIHYPPWDVARRKGHHQPLVSPETFERVSERLREGRRTPQRKDLHADFPLRGFVLCPGCAKPYTASWSRGKKSRFAYYRCKAPTCVFRNKSVRADRMHAAFGELLGNLKPRTAVLREVRAEFINEWNRRQSDVETHRKERQRKLDEIQRQIDGYLEAVGQCRNPTVLKKIEEEVEALEAKRLRLGGRIQKTTVYDFGTALDQVCEFLEKPCQMWKTGDLELRRLVQKLVFSEPIAYDRITGFGTPQFSLPVAVACTRDLKKSEVVDLIRKSWNTLAEIIREWAESLSGHPSAKNSTSAA